MLVVLLGIYSGSQSYIQAQSHTAAGFQLFFHSSGLVSFIFYFALFLIKNQQIKYRIIKMYKYTNQLQLSSWVIYPVPSPRVFQQMG